jgi:hypothetical protein
MTGRLRATPYLIRPRWLANGLVAGLLGAPFGCALLAGVLTYGPPGSLICGWINAAFIGWLAGHFAAREEPARGRRAGQGLGALAGATAGIVTMVLALGFLFRLAPMPAPFATMELSEAAYWVVRYLWTFGSLLAGTVVTIATAALAGAIGGMTAVRVSPPSTMGGNSVIALERRKQPMAWQQAGQFGLGVSALLTLVVSAPVLLCGGEELNRFYWVLASMAGCVAMAILLGAGSAGVMVIWRNIDRL